MPRRCFCPALLVILSLALAGCFDGSSEDFEFVEGRESLPDVVSRADALIRFLVFASGPKPNIGGLTTPAAPSPEARTLQPNAPVVTVNQLRQGARRVAAQGTFGSPVTNDVAELIAGRLSSNTRLRVDWYTNPGSTIVQGYAVYIDYETRPTDVPAYNTPIVGNLRSDPIQSVSTVVFRSQPVPDEVPQAPR